VLIRKLKSSDTAQVHKLVQITYTETTQDNLEAYWDPQIISGNAYGIFDHNNLLGFAISPFVQQSVEGPYFEVREIIIHKDHCNKGLGTQLFETLMAISDSYTEASKAALLVTKNNAAAISLYKKFGFTVDPDQRGSLLDMNRPPFSHIINSDNPGHAPAPE